MRLEAIAVLWLFALTDAAVADDLNPVAKVPTRDRAMSAAYVQAAAGLDRFFATWRAPPAGAERFTVKIGLIDTPGVPGYSVVRPDTERFLSNGFGSPTYTPTTAQRFLDGWAMIPMRFATLRSDR